MGRYVLTRTLRALLTVWGVVTLVFLLVRLIPGDPVQAILGDQASPEDHAALRERLHLDAPLLEQYRAFVGDVASGGLGHSFRSPDRSVGSMIAEVFPDTLVLALASMLLAFAIAIPLGVLAAVKRGGRVDAAASLVAVAGLAIPNIWLGPLLILAFAVELRVLPMPGDDAVSGVAALVLPTFTLGTALAAVLTRQTRASMAEIWNEQYILAARARGLHEGVVAIKHGLRNALLPVLTVGAAQFGAVLSGTVVTEKIFERAGLGQLFLDAFFSRDIPVVQGCVLVIALVYVFVNLLLDLSYVMIDPRVRVS